MVLHRKILIAIRTGKPFQAELAETASYIINCNLSKQNNPS